MGAMTFTICAMLAIVTASALRMSVLRYAATHSASARSYCSSCSVPKRAKSFRR